LEFRSDEGLLEVQNCWGRLRDHEIGPNKTDLTKQ